MTKLLLRFIVSLRRYDIEIGLEGQFGPRFHRWLPDGQKDAILLDANSCKLELWFVRTGFFRGGFIEFDFSRKELDPTIMVKQGVLDTGNLHGLLVTEELFSEIDLACLTDNKVGDEQYIQLGKKVLQLICPPVKVLSLLCGQTMANIGFENLTYGTHAKNPWGTTAEGFVCSGVWMMVVHGETLFPTNQSQC